MQWTKMKIHLKWKKKIDKLVNLGRHYVSHFYDFHEKHIEIFHFPEGFFCAPNYFGLELLSKILWLFVWRFLFFLGWNVMVPLFVMLGNLFFKFKLLLNINFWNLYMSKKLFLLFKRYLIFLRLVFESQNFFGSFS